MCARRRRGRGRGRAPCFGERPLAPCVDARASAAAAGGARRLRGTDGGQVYNSEKDLTEDVVAIDGVVYSLEVRVRCASPSSSCTALAVPARVARPKTAAHMRDGRAAPAAGQCTQGVCICPRSRTARAHAASVPGSRVPLKGARLCPTRAGTTRAETRSSCLEATMSPCRCVACMRAACEPFSEDPRESCIAAWHQGAGSRGTQHQRAGWGCSEAAETERSGHWGARPKSDTSALTAACMMGAQYRMIHPFHAASLVNKMPKVGTLANYRKDYKFGTPFEEDLKAAVQKVVKPNERFATFGFKVRCAFYCSLYAVLMASYVTYGSSWALCTALGVAQAFIGLNVQHDANHGAVSANPFWNDLLGFGADLIGGSKYLWLQQHWTHHAFTNDIERDPDAKSTDPFFLFHNYPQDSMMRKAVHAFQHFWMLPILSFYWLSSILSPEILTATQVPYTRAHTHTHIHTTRMQAHAHACMHACMHAYVHTYVHTYAYKQTRTIALTHTHTHTHTHTRLTHPSVSLSPSLFLQMSRCAHVPVTTANLPITPTPTCKASPTR